MSQPTCEPIVATIQQLIQDLIALDEQIAYLVEVAGMNQSSPWAYVVQQREVDQLIKKRRALQDAYNRAGTELAICRSQPDQQDQRSSQLHRSGSERLPSHTEEEEAS